MGATSGTVSCSKFFVRDMPKRGFRDRLIEGARGAVFYPLTPEDEAAERAGFCVFERPFDLDIRHDNAYFNSFLNLGLRVDRWRIPSALFKAHFREAEREAKERLGVEKLGRRQKEDVKVLLTRKLRKKTIPAMRVYDVSFDLDAGVVRFWNTSAGVNDMFEPLFEKAFDLKLMRDSAYVCCERRGLSETELDKLVKLTPATFHTESA